MILTLVLAQAAIIVPAASPARPFAAPADPDRLSLVIVQTVSETDPRPLCDLPNCTSLFLGRYRDAHTLAGPSLAAEFSARIEMGSPWIRPYRLALIVEQRDGDEPLVRATAGFNLSTGEGCFEAGETAALHWRPMGPGVTLKGEAICVVDQPTA
jgi:hypothetical protein